VVTGELCCHEAMLPDLVRRGTTQRAAPCSLHAGHVRQAVRYVNQTLPFWRRHDGKDHFYWVTNDWGTCRYPQKVRGWAQPGSAAQLACPADLLCMRTQAVGG
jgi:hypothetical protein